jgi:hypothetical protein
VLKKLIGRDGEPSVSLSHDAVNNWQVTSAVDNGLPADQQLNLMTQVLTACTH